PGATNVQLTPLRLLHYRPPARRPMPEPTPADALERMRRQVRAVRWRRNLHELQRALYHLIAGLGGAMTALVVLALRAGSGVFALATWTLAAATLLLAGGLARALARRWLSSEQAPLWIDRQTALEGRLATALELEDRDARRAPFFPLLVDDNARRIAAWRPERVVPEGLPSGAFAGALAAVGVFLLALLLAPWLRPSASRRNAGRSSGDRRPARGRRAVRAARRPQATRPVARGRPGAALASIPPSVAARQARTRPPPAPARAPTRTSSARRARSAPRASASTCRSQRAYVRSAAAQLLPPPARRRRPRPTPAPTWPPRSGATRPSSRCACRPVTR